MYEFIGYTDWSPALQWGYLLSQINLARFNWPKHPIYQKLLDVVKKIAPSNYFVMTSNVDGMFERNGFDPARIYTPQGDYGLMQCLKPCTNQVWPTKDFIDKALPFVSPSTQEITNPDVIPKCPNCGGPVMMNVRGGRWFIESPREQQRNDFEKWKETVKNSRLVIIEVGAGFNTPMVIRWPNENLVSQNNARLIRINLENSNVPGEIISRAAQLPLEGLKAIEALWDSIVDKK